MLFDSTYENVSFGCCFTVNKKVVWIAVLQYRRRRSFGLLFYSTEEDCRLDCCFTVNKKTVVWIAVLQ